MWKRKGKRWIDGSPSFLRTSQALKPTLLFRTLLRYWPNHPCLGSSQDSLSADSKTLMLVCVSPVVQSAEESWCSLNFASRVRTVELGKVCICLDGQFHVGFMVISRNDTGGEL